MGNKYKEFSRIDAAYQEGQTAATAPKPVEKKPIEIIREAGYTDAFMSIVGQYSLRIVSAKHVPAQGVTNVVVASNAKQGSKNGTPDTNKATTIITLSPKILASDNISETYRSLVKAAHLTLAQHNPLLRTCNNLCGENWGNRPRPTASSPTRPANANTRPWSDDGSHAHRGPRTKRLHDARPTQGD